MKLAYFFQRKMLLKLLFLFTINCDDKVNDEDSQNYINEDPQLYIRTDSEQNQLSGKSNIDLSVSNFPKIYKIKCIIINSSLSENKRTLMDTISNKDQKTYTVEWNTFNYPNGAYELYAEIIDSSYSRITSSKYVNVKNFSLITIENELELSVNYQIGPFQGILFSNSINQIQVERFFDAITFNGISSPSFCGNYIPLNYTISPEQSDRIISIKADSSHFFLRIKNESNFINHINTLIIKNDTDNEFCRNLYIPNNGLIYPVGYFSFNFDFYQSESISIVVLSDDLSDSTNIFQLSFFSESELVDTIIVR
jgi:hypothetical protein